MTALTIGAIPEEGGTRFKIWAPAARQVQVDIEAGESWHRIPLTLDPYGYFSGLIRDAGDGTRYRYRFDDGSTYPDPASRYQPDGVHGPSQVVDTRRFHWGDGHWRGMTMANQVIYELHVGTFTPEGSFDAAVERLDYLVDLGVTAIEVMPIANFPGRRNWGYDGVNLFAPATAYGGPRGLQRLVDAAHQRGLAVILDVVYNHLGPEGNYLPAITGGRFFTSRHRTPWGEAVNFDGPDSGPVRDFVLQNAKYWATEFHVDGLRLDAVHAIVDDSPSHILLDIARELHRLDPPRMVIAEDERNERRLVLPLDEGGYQLDGVWADDFHHSLRRLVAGDDEGYFRSYRGTADELATTLRQGWLYQGEFAEHFGRARGTSAAGIPPSAFVHCIQNHDQVGNRALGDRLNHCITPPVFRAASALLLFSPCTPLLWMGQEWAASSPFLYFTDHPEALGRLVTEGRREEFKHFSAFSEPEARDRIPDPQHPDTFHRSRLDWDEAGHGVHRGVRNLYRALLQLRQDDPVFQVQDRGYFEVEPVGSRAVWLLRRSPAGHALLLFANFGEDLVAELPRGFERATLVLNTEDPRFGGNPIPPPAQQGRVTLPGPGALVLRAA